MAESVAARALAPALASRLALAACLAITGCTGAHAGPANPGPDAARPAKRDPLLSVARSVANIGAQALVDRLQRTPMRTFRYLASPFVEATCDSFARGAEALPIVNLHGDAHIEQYAVAEDGRGLADFDAATTGPFVVDLVRFATSLRIAASMRRFPPAAAEEAIDAFLRGYRAGLANPDVVVPEPKVVARLRGRFAPDARTWLDRVESLMEPLEPPMQAKLEAAYAPFVAAMREQNPDLSESFFRIRHVGNLEMGVGSVNERKFLARVAGPTDASEDDVIYEVKEVMRIEPGTCVAGDPERDPLRVIRGQERLSGVHQRFLGFVRIDGRAFYVHTWRVNYTELAVEDVATSEELAEVAYDVGVQLGRGHPQGMAAPPRTGTLARAIGEALDDTEPEIREAARALEGRTRAAWEEIRRAPPRDASVAMVPRSDP
jgi:hypothetical protein